jgi:hypothetical protein
MRMNKSKRILPLLSCILILFVIFGCTDERKTKLERGIGFMRSFTNPNPIQMGAIANYNADSDPAGLIMLYHSSLEADGSYPEAYSDRQSLQPWSLLVLPGTKERSLIVEGYGDDLKKPIIVEEIIFKKR